MDVDGQEAFSKLVASLDLVPDPFTVIRLRAKQHHSHGRTFELLLDPFFYAARSFLRLFELCLVIEGLGFATGPNQDRKGVVWGKSVSVRVDPGGSWILKKQKKQTENK